MQYSTLRSMKSAAVLIEDGAFARFFRPRRWAFGSSSVPASGNLHDAREKMPMPRGYPQGGGGYGRTWN